MSASDKPLECFSRASGFPYNLGKFIFFKGKKKLEMLQKGVCVETVVVTTGKGL